MDIVSTTYIPNPQSSHLEVIIGNLCDHAFCNKVIQGVHTVLHFAANMGGMGAIHSDNDFIIYSENHTMSLNLLSAAISAGVKQFLFASSACVYPESLQSTDNSDVSLRETDVWVNAPPKPQGLYGLEKLAMELVLAQYSKVLDIRIARFHNIFGPGGAWSNGREKVPAALLRKAIATKIAGIVPAIIEVWGDGSQRRSFLSIEDCVRGIISLLASSCTVPVNIGSDRSISIKELCVLAMRSAGVDPVQADLVYDGQKPTGVASRNSNNDFVRKMLNWEPEVSLEEGMGKTATWIEKEMSIILDPMDDAERQSTLLKFQRSEIVDMTTEGTTFAILLPITSRGSHSPSDCLVNLARFAKSLVRTTKNDVHNIGGPGFRLKAYLAVDKDDGFLLDGADNKAAAVLRKEGILPTDIVVLVCDFPRGHVCSLWRECARSAKRDGCDYFVLMGDDVVLEDEGWMSRAYAEFADISQDEGVPLGFGVVAFTDITFPGMPTFPILHRTHLDIFEGEVVPEIFINQDGDPYLYQLYRRWGCSRMFDSRIRNTCGGSDDARYEKKHTNGWTFATLQNSVDVVDLWLRKMHCAAEQKLTLDVVVPCYRVQLEFLGPILRLKSSKTCTVMFIIIVDNPSSPQIVELQKQYAHRPDIRIRINTKNIGASASRNRGMAESSARWIHFLDDDISPDPNLLIEAEKAIRSHPDSAGFVGNSQFPSADSVFTAAVHLAGVTYFWDIAAKMSGTKMEADLPWGVTANLISRRDVQDGIEYDLDFPKTGGGEDIAFCLDKREASVGRGGNGFHAAPKVIVTHPWWSGGKRSYKRFYMWSVGDGGLIKKYPHLTYYDAAPNSAELLLVFVAILILGTGFGVVTSSNESIGLVATFTGKNVFAVFVSNILHDCYRHLYRNVDRTRTFPTTVTGIHWFIAVLDSTILRIASEGGRVMGILQRKEFTFLGTRFDWFAGKAGDGPKGEERLNSSQRFFLYLVIALFILV